MYPIPFFQIRHFKILYQTCRSSKVNHFICKILATAHQTSQALTSADTFGFYRFVFFSCLVHLLRTVFSARLEEWMNERIGMSGKKVFQNEIVINLMLFFFFSFVTNGIPQSWDYLWMASNNNTRRKETGNKEVFRAHVPSEPHRFIYLRIVKRFRCENAHANFEAHFTNKFTGYHVTKSKHPLLSITRNTYTR